MASANIGNIRGGDNTAPSPDLPRHRPEGRRWPGRGATFLPPLNLFQGPSANKGAGENWIPNKFSQTDESEMSANDPKSVARKVEQIALNPPLVQIGRMAPCTGSNRTLAGPLVALAIFIALAVFLGWGALAVMAGA